MDTVLISVTHVQTRFRNHPHLSLQEVKENFSRNRQMEIHKAGRKTLCTGDRIGGRLPLHGYRFAGVFKGGMKIDTAMTRTLVRVTFPVRLAVPTFIDKPVHCGSTVSVAGIFAVSASPGCTGYSKGFA